MKKILSTVAALLMLMMVLSSCGQNNNTNTTENVKNNVKSVKAISEVFGDGQKVSAVAIEYDTEIDSKSLSASDFAVDGKTVTKVYTNNAAEKSESSVPGKYVIVELSVKAEPLSHGSGGGARTNDGGGSNSQGNANNGGSPSPQGNPNGAGVFKASPVTSAVVTQTGDISTTKGKVYAASTESMKSTKEEHLIVDDFKHLEYTDSATGLKLKYNLYVPKNYDKSKSYPMVLFIHDASVVGGDVTRTLTQGLGAVVWASPSEQAKHEAFVLAPQYDNQTANDNFETTKDLDATVSLLKDIMKQYSIDQNRVYITGQSMGCMSSIALLLRQPDLFTAGMLVAGQWDPTVMAPMAKDKLWILVAEGDQRSSAGMDAAMNVWKAAGASISKAVWNGQASKEEQAANVSAMTAENTNIKYVKFANGTVVPGNPSAPSNENHLGTWPIAYNIEGVRDWLFKQVKTSK